MEEKDKPTILLVSDLVVPTGFARVTHSIFSHLLDRYDLVGLGVNYNGDPHTNPLPVYPAQTMGNPKDIYGYQRIASIIKKHRPDIVWMLNDPWSIAGYLQVIDKELTRLKLEVPKLVAYFPVDSEYHDPDWFEDFDKLSSYVTYTNFGADVVGESTDGNKFPTVIPHGTDSSVFYPMDKTEAKREMYSNQPWYSDDAFIVLNANRNQPRKRLDLSLQGFAMFAKDKPENVKIHMHCGVIDSGFDIIKLARRYGVEERLIISNLVQGIQTIPDEKMNVMYNATDVGINTSMGEGWGLTNTEHAVTRTAQIVPNHSACAEIFHDCGLLIDAPIPYTYDHTQTVGRLVSPGSLADHLQNLYDNPDLRNELAEKAYTKFTGESYKWENIANSWDVIFQGALNDPNDELASEHEGDDSTDN